jgi:hypothetical protein
MISVALQYNPRLTEGERTILAIPTKLRNLRVLMQTEIAPALNRMLLRHWSSKGTAFGHPWAPWSPETLRKRLRKGNVEKGLLRDTDHLFNTIFRDRPTDDRLKAVGSGLKLELNTRVPYALYHQVGTRFMPERQIFPNPLPDSFKREVRAILKQYLLAS